MWKKIHLLCLPNHKLCEPVFPLSVLFRLWMTQAYDLSDNKVIFKIKKNNKKKIKYFHTALFWRSNNFLSASQTGEIKTKLAYLINAYKRKQGFLQAFFFFFKCQSQLSAANELYITANQLGFDQKYPFHVLSVTGDVGRTQTQTTLGLENRKLFIPSN